MVSKRNIWVFGLLFLLGVTASDLHATYIATDEIYAVKNIAVDVEGENAIDAREKALTKARRDAFDILSGRLLSATEKSGMGHVDDNTINSMVNDFEINREKFSRNRYLANVDVRFNERAVRSYLGRFTYSALPDTTYRPQQPVTQPYQDNSFHAVDSYYARDAYAPRPQETVTDNAVQVGLILPWYKQNGHPMLWHDTNPWMDAWKQWTQTDQAREMRLITPIGDITDMQIFNPEKPLNYDQSALVRLLDRYNADYAVIALADPLPNGMLDIGLYQSTTSVPRFIDKIIAPATVNSGVAAFFPAIWQSAKRIAEAPRSMTASYGDENRTATVRGADIPSFSRDNTVLVPFEAEISLNNIRQWVGIRQSLSQLPGMQDMQVRSLSAGRAVIGFRYAGDIEALNLALRHRGMNIYRNPVLTPGKVPYIIVPSQS